jgi:hypothetical protein
MKLKFGILSLLSVLVIALGVAVPAYMNREQPTSIGGPFHTPRPTSTRYSETLKEIVEVVTEEESQEDSDELTNCTYPLYYWKEYPDSWPSQIIIAGKIYTREDMFRVYHTVEPDTATLLVQELYTAFLNILGGASHSRIDPVIVDANSWLETNPPGTAISELNQQIGMNLANSLEDYNNGLNGPPPCKDVPPSPTPSPTITETPVPSETNTPTPTTRAVSTPSRIQPPSDNQSAQPVAPFQPTATQIIPTATMSFPTIAVPTATLQLVPPTAAPTLTPVVILPTATSAPLLLPTPTNTQLPPTRTNTPLPTSSFTPLPTSTYTPVPPFTETPITPTITETPPEPTVTEESQELLPTRNPHYVSPTPFASP